ncbi:MAG: aminotransferase class I/II-fold pyridoxal phosphate-dependent enzyme [Methanobacteriota archaeon]|nr:MAG: aminotransferase class I/II-fold pyridoxal phosphate-dependent enzyme [Euryarchaeota archaeon]
MPRRKPETAVVHPKKGKGHGPMVEPVHLTTTWQLDSAKQGAAFSSALGPEAFYTRWGNPTTRVLEESVAELEGGAKAIATGSGMGAISSAILAVVSKGDLVVAGKSLYSATTELFTRVLPRWGVETTFVDPAKRGSWREAVTKNTTLVYAESPANPTMGITDLREAAEAAHAVGAIAMTDNTFATPINQRPIEHGFDVVLHSATKYLGGHTDVTAGVIVMKTDELWDRIWFLYKILGPAIGPMDAYLVRRGMKTLPQRVRQQNATAQALAEFLEDHAQVERVHYPGLKTFPQHALAKRQMDGFGGMLSFEIKGGRAAGIRFVESVEVATLAVSLGGAETLVQHPASMTHGPLTDEERALSGISDGLIRVSVGLEHVDDLIADFAQALKKAR